MKSNEHSTNSVEEELRKTIKGYQGYTPPEKRNKTDKNLRNFILTQLKSIDNQLLKFEKQIGDQNHNGILNRVSSSLKTIIDSLQNPCYANQPFFSDSKINPGVLAQLYEYDTQLKEQIEILEDEAKLVPEIGNDNEIKEFLNHLFDLIDGVNQTLTEREFLIMSEGV